MTLRRQNDGIESNIVLKEEVRDLTPLLLLTDRTLDSSSVRGSDISRSPEFIFRGTVRANPLVKSDPALGSSVLVLSTVLSSNVGLAVARLSAPRSIVPVTGGLSTGDAVVTLLPTGSSVEETLEVTVEVDPGGLPATVTSAGTHWPLAFISSICLKVSLSGKGMLDLVRPVRSWV
jgi:hypothetical protein